MMGDREMKRKCLWLITIFIIIIISTLMYLYLGGTDTYQRIDIYTTKNFNKEIDTPIASIGNKKTVKEISTIIRASEKMPGILNVASPNYILEIHSFNKSIQTIYLWIGKNSVQGMYMYKDNTESGYSMSESNTQELNKIVTTTNN
jgi:hypothetical protein